ncbi:MAG: ABC transporter ATP-binding protein [Alphaproteobacteria bacterium]|nr:ABC transporter ATP-binding protein [Alphaproteobacteria bacterium]
MAADPTNARPPLLSVANLRVSIASDEGLAQVLDGVSLDVAEGRIVGVVGESGCGKSTLVRAVLGILPRGARTESGSIHFAGEDLLTLDERAMTRRIRGRAIGFIPQDPYLALNPVFRVGTQLLEIMRWHGDGSEDGAGPFNRARRARHRLWLIQILKAVQLPDPEQALDRYPHQFSGGQRQRLLIAGALACRPRLVIADEPTTALDVTTQLEILKLLKRLVAEFGVSMLFVTHDVGVVAQLCDEVAVMYAGQSVEWGGTGELLARPRHPYTVSLLACHPDRADGLVGIAGQVPSALAPPTGCRFHPRCGKAMAACAGTKPETTPSGDRHTVACMLYGVPDA